MSQYGDTVMFLLTDHLGSSSIVTDEAGALIGEVRYKAWGDTRYDDGNVPTKQRYTGQREETELGLYYYGARWYNDATGRFVQADTIIPQPGNPVAWDRYAYVLNNPARLVDPTGHMCSDPEAGTKNSTCDGADKQGQRNVHATSNTNNGVTSYQPHGPATTYQGNEPTWNPAPTAIPPTIGQNTQSTQSPADSFNVDQWILDQFTHLPESLSKLRETSGMVDPFEPGALTGSNLDPLNAYVQAVQTVVLIYPNLANYKNPLTALVPIIPGAAASYDYSFDQITNTGPYSSLPPRAITTPGQAVVTILTIIIIIPILPP